MPSGSSEDDDGCAKTEGKRRAQMEDAGGKRGGGGGREGGGWKGVGVRVNGIRGNINTAGLSNEPECDLRIFQRTGELA